MEDECEVTQQKKGKITAQESVEVVPLSSSKGASRKGKQISNEPQIQTVCGPVYHPSSSNEKLGKDMPKN